MSHLQRQILVKDHQGEQEFLLTSAENEENRTGLRLGECTRAHRRSFPSHSAFRKTQAGTQLLMGCCSQKEYAPIRAKVHLCNRWPPKDHRTINIYLEIKDTRFAVILW